MNERDLHVGEGRLVSEIFLCSGKQRINNCKNVDGIIETGGARGRGTYCLYKGIKCWNQGREESKSAYWSHE